jgi:hypothetical protein
MDDRRGVTRGDLKPLASRLARRRESRSGEAYQRKRGREAGEEPRLGCIEDAPEKRTWITCS